MHSRYLMHRCVCTCKGLPLYFIYSSACPHYIALCFVATFSYLWYSGLLLAQVIYEGPLTGANCYDIFPLMLNTHPISREIGN